jgi:hypothetical protein
MGRHLAIILQGGAHTISDVIFQSQGTYMLTLFLIKRLNKNEFGENISL